MFRTYRYVSSHTPEDAPEWHMRKESRPFSSRVHNVRRVFSSFLALALVWVLAIATAIIALALPAQAAGKIRVAYEEANPRTGNILYTSDDKSCTALPTGDEYIGEISDTVTPGAQGNCSFIAAHYSRDGVDLIIRELKIDNENNRIIIVPEVSEKRQADQNHVQLSISFADLEKAAEKLGSSPIKLYYGDSSQFRRIALSLDSNMKAAEGNSQPDINVDGTQMTGTRLLYLFRETLPDGSVAYVRNINVDVPRLWQISMRETTIPRTDLISFKQTNDNSTVDRTVQQWDIIYTGGADQTVKAEVTASKFDTVKMHATTYANIWDVGHMHKLDEHGVDTYNGINWDSEAGFYKTQSPYNAGGGYAQGRYYDGALLPFFYKVMSTTGDTMVNDGKGVFAYPEADKKYRGEVFRRTGIPVRARSSDSSTWPMHWFANGHKCHDGACSWINMHKWNKGENWDNTWHEPVTKHLLSASIDAPKPVKGVSGWMTDWRIVDVQDTADPEWPIVENVKWEDSKTPLEQNAAGKDSYVSFYVQFNGIENTPLRDDNFDNWSYFLGRVRVNGQWISVPFPNIPKQPLGPFLSSSGCFLPLVPADGNQGRFSDGTKKPYGWDLDDMQYFDGKFHSTCESDYTKARERIFTPLGAKNPGRTVKTVAGDMFDTDAGDRYVYSMIGLTPEQISDIDQNISSGRQLQETYDPVVLVDDKDRVTGRDKTVSFGENAGMKVKVELVNARSQGDLLADGFSSFTSSGGKTVSRANRHTPSPRVGPAVQMTNISTSDRSKLDWDMDRDLDDNGWVSDGNLAENQRSARRSGAQSNQWKTLYKVTITGMMTPKVDVHFQYDYTSKPKFWNAGSDPAKYVQVKEMQGARGGGETDYTHTPAWRDRSTEGGIEEEAVCNRNNMKAERWVATDDAGYAKCDASIADDMAIASELAEGEGNLKFELKDGFIKPRLTTAYNRLETDYCIDPESGITADGANGTYKTKNTKDACEKRSHNGALWQFRWNYNNEEPAGWNRDSTGSGKVRTDTSTSFRVDADAVRLPAIMMTGSKVDATASKVVSEQWSGDTLTPQKVDKESNYFMKVLGDVPAPITVEENGKKVRKAFTGYELYAVNCQDPKDCTAASSKTQLTRMYADRVFYPGDAIDLRAVDSKGDPVIRLSNDTYLGQRYDAFWLVPTYGTPLNASLKLYEGQKYYADKGVDAPGEKYSEEPFYFYGAPGLTVTGTDEPGSKNLPRNIKVGEKNYYYSARDSFNPAVIGDDDDTPLKFVYREDEGATLEMRVKWHFIDGASGEEMPDAKIPPAWVKNVDYRPSIRPDVPQGTVPGIEPGEDRKYYVKWDTTYSTAPGVGIFVRYDATNLNKDGLHCEASPSTANLYRIRINGGKETKEQVNKRPLIAISQVSDYQSLQDSVYKTELESGANIYQVEPVVKCWQSITVYSLGDRDAFANPVTNIPMPKNGVPQATGPEDFSYSSDSANKILNADERRDDLFKRMTAPHDSFNKPYYSDWQPFHAEVKNHLLDYSSHTEVKVDAPSSEYAPNGVLDESKDKREIKWTAKALSPSNTDQPMGSRQTEWLPAGDWAAHLSNHLGWGYEFDCPAGEDKVVNGQVVGVSLSLGQNVVCYIRLHTSEVSVVMDVPDDSLADWEPIFWLNPDDKEAATPVTSSAKLVKEATVNSAPDSPFEQLRGKVDFQVQPKSTLKGMFSEPHYYLFTNKDKDPTAEYINANIKTAGDWTELATQKQLNKVKAYEDWWEEDTETPTHAYLYKVVDYREDGTPIVETYTSGELYGKPKPFAPEADQLSVLKVAIEPVIPVVPILPFTGGIPADLLLLLGAGVGVVGLLGAWWYKRKRA